MTRPDSLTPEQRASLVAHAGDADQVIAWPEASWEQVQAAGVLRWCIPVEYAGQGLKGTELLNRYHDLAEACLTTAFVLSQRDAACRRLRDSANEELAGDLLPLLAAGERFATVGISQLTTSGQHRRPSLQVRQAGDAFILDGHVPWVTGAARADYVVIGGALDDGRQVLLVVSRDCPGLSIGPPMELMALRGSVTSEITCREVRVESHWLLAGPAERVVTTGKGSTGGLETSALALGLARGALDDLHTETQARPDLRDVCERLTGQYTQLISELQQAAEDVPPAEELALFRGRANDLVLRTTQAALAASKGTGFVQPHPAQRRARQALFFLVWSCPRPAVDATLSHLCARE